VAAPGQNLPFPTASCFICTVEFVVSWLHNIPCAVACGNADMLRYNSLAKFPRYYHIYSVCDWLWPWEVLRSRNYRFFFGGGEVGERPLTVKFSKFPLENFHRDTDRQCCCSNFVKFGRREIGEIVRYLPYKKNRLPVKLSLLHLHGSHQKFARANSQKCTQSAPDFIQIGSLSAEL